MKNSITFFLLILSQLGFAQKSKLRITPYLGLGVKLPDPQELISGTYQMTQLYPYSQVGVLYDNSGNEIQSYNTTNRLGFDLGYDLKENLEVHVGVNRTNLISSFAVPFTYSYLKQNVEKLVDNYAIIGGTLGFKYNFPNRTWINLEGQITPDYGRNNRNLYGSAFKPGGNLVGATGDGLRYLDSATPKTLTSVYFGVGKKLIFDLNVELGISLGLQSVGTYDISYFKAYKVVGQSKIDEKFNGIFLTVRQPINLGFKVKDKTPKPPKEPKAPKEPKVKPPKPTPKEKESYEFKDKVIFKGEDIVLDNIKFLQSKSELLAPGMKELDAVFELLKKYPDTKVSLTGHTSTEGNRKDNINLSEDRAESCKDYLVSKGIKSSRIKAYGLGPDKPISSTNPELNRRVEIKVF